MSTSIADHFSSLRDPRIERNKLYPLMEILLLVVCAKLSGANAWEAIEEFGKNKLDWLRRFAPLANGIPSHDRIADRDLAAESESVSGVLSQLDTHGCRDDRRGIHRHRWQDGARLVRSESRQRV